VRGHCCAGAVTTGGYPAAEIYHGLLNETAVTNISYALLECSYGSVATATGKPRSFIFSLHWKEDGPRSLIASGTCYPPSSRGKADDDTALHRRAFIAGLGGAVDLERSRRR
jgi:hypothetical protein